MKALETANGKLFLDDVERLGFLPDPDNQDGLPVGLTSGVTIGLEFLGPMVGLNCAACHVGELHCKGKRFRIDGAPSLLNTRDFFKTLIDSGESTAADPAKLLAFLIRVKQNEEKAAGVEPSKLSGSSPARSLLKVVQKEEEAFKALLLPVIDKIIKTADDLDLAALLRDGVQDEQKVRAKIVKDLKLDHVAELVKKSTVVQELKDDIEKNRAVTHLLEEVLLSVRLLRARAVFLKKLGAVGENPLTNWGAGRDAAFGSARAFLFTNPSATYDPVNPVSYPPIFELKSHDWFHYDNNTNTFLEPQLRPSARRQARFYDPKTLNSTLQTKNLLQLEKLAGQLSAPKWPEDILGKIDLDRAKRGEKLYAKYCAECHNPPKEGDPFARLFELDDINTDKGRADMFAAKLADGTPFSVQIFATRCSAIKLKEIADFPKDQKDAIMKKPPEVKWQGPDKYSARTIKGSWATAPYLHNGSVLNLWELLLPAKLRTPIFYVGSHQYDVEKLGYVSDDKMTKFVVATPGNSNQGHEGEKYGTNINDDERKDLLEYLKTQ